MQKENKNQEDNTSSKDRTFDKIDYTIQTMNSDLKKKDPKEKSLELKEKKIKEEPKKKPEKPEKPTPEKNFNPFLDDLQPIEKFKSEPEKPENLSLLSSKDKNIPKLKSLEKNSRDKKSGNFLLIFLFILSLITAGAGIYYYYSHLNSKTESSLPKTKPEEKTPTQLTSTPPKLLDRESLNVKDFQTLVETITNKSKNLPLSTTEYYQVKDLNSSETLSLLNIELPEEVLNNLDKNWIMAYRQKDVLKINLVLEITKDANKIEEILLNNEYKLPLSLQSLFIQENFVLRAGTTEFKNSKVLDNIRYFNLVEGFNDKAIDWGIIDDKYLIITTSKETARAVINDLKKSN